MEPHTMPPSRSNGEQSYIPRRLELLLAGLDFLADLEFSLGTGVEHGIGIEQASTAALYRILDSAIAHDPSYERFRADQDDDDEDEFDPVAHYIDSRTEATFLAAKSAYSQVSRAVKFDLQIVSMVRKEAPADGYPLAETMAALTSYLIRLIDDVNGFLAELDHPPLRTRRNIALRGDSVEARYLDYRDNRDTLITQFIQIGARLGTEDERPRGVSPIYCGFFNFPLPSPSGDSTVHIRSVLADRVELGRKLQHKDLVDLLCREKDCSEDAAKKRIERGVQTGKLIALQDKGRRVFPEYLAREWVDEQTPSSRF